MKLNLITQEPNRSGLDDASSGWSQLGNILDLAQSRLPPVVTGTSTPLAHINPRHLLNDGSPQARQGDIIEPGTTSGSGLHQFNTGRYYSPQDILDSQTSFIPPTEPNDDIWDTTLDGRPSDEVNIMILNQKFAYPSTLKGRLFQRDSKDRLT